MVEKIKLKRNFGESIYVGEIEETEDKITIKTLRGEVIPFSRDHFEGNLLWRRVLNQEQIDNEVAKLKEKGKL